MGPSAGDAPVIPADPERWTRDDIYRWVTEEVRLTPAVLPVREFAHHSNFRVCLWPDLYIRPGDTNWRPGEVAMYQWLKGECFDLVGYAADWRGRLTRPTFED